MSRNTTIALLIGLFLISSPAMAGGGPPQTFEDLEQLAEYNIGQIQYFENTGELSAIWPEDACRSWSYLLDNLGWYFQNEGLFIAVATENKVRNLMRTPYQRPTPQLFKKWQQLQEAVQQLDKMTAWHATFADFREMAWMQRAYYCDKEQMCVASDPEPAKSTVDVWKKDIGQVLRPGSQVHIMTFYLNVNPGDAPYNEDGILDKVTLSLIVTGNNFENVSNCSLSKEGIPLSAHIYPFVNNDLGVAQLNFYGMGHTLPRGVTQAFDVRCDIDVMEKYSYIHTGFIPELDTSPSDAIFVYGMNTNERLSVTQDTEISTLLLN